MIDKDWLDPLKVDAHRRRYPKDPMWKALFPIHQHASAMLEAYPNICDTPGCTRPICGQIESLRLIVAALDA